MESPEVDRAQGCVQANYQQLILDLQLTYCIILKYLNEVKKCFGKGFGRICALYINMYV